MHYSHSVQLHLELTNLGSLLLEGLLVRDDLLVAELELGGLLLDGLLKLGDVFGVLIEAILNPLPEVMTILICLLQGLGILDDGL